MRKAIAALIVAIAVFAFISPLGSLSLDRESMKESYRKYGDEVVRKKFEIDLQHAERNLPASMLPLARAAYAAVHYQRAVDRMVCLERRITFQAMSSMAFDIDDCIAELDRGSTELQVLLASSDARSPLFEKCELDARQEGLEGLYPPYDFLFRDGKKPKAYDAEQYAGCIRTNYRSMVGDVIPSGIPLLWLLR